MVLVLSRFRVANHMELDVVRAFRNRPREVEHAAGFLWLEVFADLSDAAVFYLLTRWADLEAFERWHRSPQHRDSHALIPKGLKLDAEWTRVCRLGRIDGATGDLLTDAVADATLLVDRFAKTSPAVHFLVLDRDGIIRSCNPTACDHLAEGRSLTGEQLTEYMPEADAACLRELLSGERHGNRPCLLNFAMPQRSPYTLECWVHLQGAQATLIGLPTFKREQQLQDQLMAINQELAVLSRERAREALDERATREVAEKLNRERNAFLSILSHELRQPIGGALAAMSILRKINPDPALEAPRSVLERQLRQITRLVDDLTDTARVAGGEVELRRATVDLAALLRELSTAWEAEAQQHHQTFTAQLLTAPVWVWGDSDRLQQVFSNLVNNASKYTPAGGAIAVRLAVDRGEAVVEIHDEGEGILPEHLSRIFTLFQRETKTGSGLGVGLAVVRALVEAHRGTVSAASDGVGCGATFTVRLPLLQ